MPIVQQGTLNTTALVVPDLYVQIVPPQNLYLNGVPTNVVGVVGTATWGPVNTATLFATMADYARAFGAVMARKYDMGTAVAAAVQQGASNFRGVRVTDGTDTAASCIAAGAGGTALTISTLYTGSLGNGIHVSIVPGAQTGTWRVVVAPPNVTPEVFDNIPATGSVWGNIGAVLNNGQLQYGRGPSQYVVATLGPNAALAPVPSSTWNGTNNTTGTGLLSGMTGGTDGAGNITAATLIGVDTLPRHGMYALRGQGCSIGVLADTDDSTQWTTQAQFGLSEGLYMILTGPAGDTIANAITTKSTAGLDSYAAKLMFGDWIWWNDQVNGVLRLVSPQGFVAGRLANLSPQNSSLNKQLYSVVGSQKSGAPGSGTVQTYSEAELSALFQAGIDVIANPQPGGKYWGVRCGHNSSSNPSISGDNYTRMTNYIAATLAAGMGLYVGLPINSDLFKQIRGTQIAFLQALLTQGLLGTLDGSLPYSVVCDLSNNPFSRTSLGYVQSDAQVQYQAINEKFIVNIEGGQTVTINKQTLPSGQ